MKLPFARKRSVKTSSAPQTGVVLAPGSSGSSVFFDALADAIKVFPGALGSVRLPSDKATFKATFPEVVLRFEAHRAGSPERVAIARALVKSLQDKLMFNDGATSTPLASYLTRDHGAVDLKVVGGRGAPAWPCEIPWRQQTYVGVPALKSLVAAMHADHLVTNAGRVGLDWTLDHIVASGFDLRGQRFALLGAGAELAPTEMLLRAGADVLWVDRAAPPERFSAGDFAGRLYIPQGGKPGPGSMDLLAEPGRVREAIIAFAAGAPVHLGLYAYAPGKGRELRLAAVMDAIARSLPKGVAASLSLLVSPTTPGEVQPEDRDIAVSRRAGAAVWKKALEKSGVLKPLNHETVGATTVSRSVVSLQGAAYQAAQYLAKMMTAEALLADGIAGQAVSISANVAGITATRSLLHPLFQAGFLGAPRFGIEIYEPATTRAISGLLMLHDVLDPQAPGAAARSHEPLLPRAKSVAAQSIHGGTRSLPWGLEATIRVGALIGLGKRPKLLVGLIPRKKKR